MTYLDKGQVEIATIDYFCELGYKYFRAPDIAPGEPQAERENYHKTVLKQLLLNTLLPKFIFDKIHIDEENP